MNAIIEPFFYCLISSLLWAPVILLGALHLTNADDKNASAIGRLSAHIWPAALLLAALPVLAAPIAATFGFSLRAPAPLAPLTDISDAAMVMSAVLSASASATTPTLLSVGDMLRMTFVLYMYGFAMILALAGLRHIWFAYRINYATPVEDPALIKALADWRIRMGVKRQPRYVFSSIVSSVCVCGVFRPIVVFPETMLSRVSIEDAALMGAHEMAHIKRNDVVFFALCSFVKIIFWFNPFMHAICKRANLAAEQRADATVLESGGDRRQYARCFVQGLKVASSQRLGFADALVPSFTPFDKRSRRARLDAILSGSRPKTRLSLSLSKKLTLAGCAVTACGLAFAQAALAVSPPSAAQALPVTPVDGTISLGYGLKDEALGANRPAHEGVDIRANHGEPVRAAGMGKVTDATAHYRGGDSWGKVVVIDHGHGLITRYAHLDSYVVRKGDEVRPGDVIGAVGSSGDSTGPHLHFEVINDGAAIDPTPLIVPSLTAAPNPPVRSSRLVRIAPAPPAATVHPIAPDAVKPDDTEIMNALERKLAHLERNLRRQFSEFDDLRTDERFSIHVGDIKLEGFEGADELSALLSDQSFALSELGDTNTPRLRNSFDVRTWP